MNEIITGENPIAMPNLIKEPGVVFVKIR